MATVPVMDRELRALFTALKTKATHFMSIFKVSSLIGSPILGGSDQKRWLTPVLAGRLVTFIGNQEPKDAGLLADILANILSPTYEEKLQILAAVNIKTRVALVLELLHREATELTTGLSLRITTTTTIPIHNDDHDEKNKPISITNLPMPLTNMFPGPPHTNNNNKDGNKSPSEIEVLQKRLEAARLPPDAQKLVDRQLRQMKHMMHGHSDYSIAVNWLETMAEVPWSIVTNDRLSRETLARAKKHLDDDHHGLEKVKRRLVEYLAVLRLKQIVNDELEEKIRLAEEEEEEEEDAELKSREREREGEDNEDEDGKGGLLPSPKLTKVMLLKARRAVDRPPILLLVGPPGVGKTSLAKSVAAALGRRFHRISLGGVRDEPEIRGHRRTYIAAMPGVIVQGLKKVGVANPVILLDEIDKLGQASNMGDPSAAMLEVLDPEQNHTFTDHYLGTPLDLSKCLFIASANSVERIPEPLLDRMEALHLNGYTTMEKRRIAMDFLVPKQTRANGLAKAQTVFGEEVVAKIIEDYTREAGVRNLERAIGSVCRAKAVDYTEARDDGHADRYRAVVTVEDVEAILGAKTFNDDIVETTNRPGIVTGLAAYYAGGCIQFIEVADMPGNGQVQLTGRLGEVLRESSEVALSWVKAHAYELGLTDKPTTDVMEGRNIHVHCPHGAVMKEGSSAGITQAIALVSLFSGKAVPPTLAMTVCTYCGLCYLLPPVKLLPCRWPVAGEPCLWLASFFGLGFPLARNGV